jgi:DNA replication and repair protein RecF
MVLDTLILQQFRSYPKSEFRFAPGITLIVGSNTAGKTNILEALYMLATGKSFRADVDREVIRWNQEIARMTAKGSDTKLELMVTAGEVNGQHAPLKKYLVNGIPRRQVDFVGNLRAVLFWPEHLELVTDSPSVRRKYLDGVLVQVDREYHRNLNSYERGVRQRNKLLGLIWEGKARPAQLLFWDQLLIAAGNYLTDARQTYINFVNGTSLPSSQYRIVYDKSIISQPRLTQYAAEEIASKSTLVGPHRDDFSVEKMQPGKSDGEEPDGFRNVAKFGSRGEQRLAVLWLKLAEVAYIQEKTGERPILLLDDIFSELDTDHRELVLQVITKQQTVLTSAEDDVTALVRGVKPSAVTVIQLGKTA